MKPKIFIVLILLVAGMIGATAYYGWQQHQRSKLLSEQCCDDNASATCTGSKSCRACKNCKYCKHCAKDGGTCGVCK